MRQSRGKFFFLDLAPLTTADGAGSRRRGLTLLTTPSAVENPGGGGSAPNNPVSG